MSRETCMASMRELQKKEGYLIFFDCAKALSKERIAHDRPKRDKTSTHEIKIMLHRQGGKCNNPLNNPDCEGTLNTIRKNYAVDHINSHESDPQFYNSINNKQLLCKSCNSKKSDMTMQDMSRQVGKTSTQIIREALHDD